MAAFEILTRGKKDNFSIIFPSAALRGICVSMNTMDDEEQMTGKLAEATDKDIMGFLSRDLTTLGGPTTDEQLFGDRAEAPDKAGKETSINDVEQYACEGSDFLSTTNPVVSGTAIGTPLNFVAGKIRLAQTGEYAPFILAGKPAAQEGNALRIVAQRVRAFKV